MPSVRNLLLRFGLDIRPPGPAPIERVPATAPPPLAAAAKPITPPAAKPAQPRPPAPGPTVVVRRPPGARVDLIEALNSPLKADQALWAPELLTPTERDLAEQVIRRYRP